VIVEFRGINEVYEVIERNGAVHAAGCFPLYALAAIQDAVACGSLKWIPFLSCAEEFGIKKEDSHFNPTFFNPFEIALSIPPSSSDT